MLMRTDHKELKQQNGLALSAVQVQKPKHGQKKTEDSDRVHYLGVFCNKRGTISALTPKGEFDQRGRGNL